MENETPLDPFAVDFFGVRTPAMFEDEPVLEAPQITKKPVKQKKQSEWFASLPKVSRQEAEFSNVLQSLPSNLAENAAEKVSEILAHYTFSQPKTVKCSVISTSEVVLHNAAEQIAKSPHIFLTINCQQEKSCAVVGFNTDFAASIINLTLGGKGAEISSHKKLSAIEKTILEFLCVNIFSEINEIANYSLLCLQNIDETAPAIFPAPERGVEVVFRVDFPTFSGIVSLLANKKFLNILNRGQIDLTLKNQPRRNAEKLFQLSPKIDSRLYVGTTTLAAGNLSFLEPDDIILIENPEFQRLDDISEAKQFFLGSGTNVKLTGNFVQVGDGVLINFQIKEFLSEEKRRVLPFTKFTMDVNENEFPDAKNEENGDFSATDETDANFSARENTEDLSALENVQVNLRVEIAGDKISLRELQNFRAGQIIALGCRPTDPVKLVADNSDQTIATGELIEIEGQLGVRLTKVFI